MADAANAKTGVLLIQLGTPDAPQTAEVRTYLDEFLNDPYVIDSHPVARWLLLNLIILPRRPKASAEAYREVWTDEGSPLMVHSEALTERVAEKMPDFEVVLGMRYGNPSLAKAIEALRDRGCTKIIALPLYPQEAWSSTRTAVEKAREDLARIAPDIEMVFVPPFFDDPGFLDAGAEVARDLLASFKPDYHLFSFHGLPARHIRKADPTGKVCLQGGSPACCDTLRDDNRRCYRAQCLYTARQLATRLDIADDVWQMGFQSRLTRGWIEPFSDVITVDLAKKGIKRLAVFCPAFVADCLETLEEIAIRMKEDFVEAGGEDLLLIPSLNATPRWVDTVVDLVKRRDANELGDIDYSHFR